MSRRLDRETLTQAAPEARERLAKWLFLGCGCVECIAREVQSDISVRQEIVEWRSQKQSA